jgi:DNA repair protein RadD
VKTLRPYQQDAITEAWKALIKNDDPVLLMASVGAGKSLILGEILLKMQRTNKKALCLVNNAELVRNNCETFISQGGKASIFCAALKEKNISESIIFATPQTVVNAIDKNQPISEICFNLIVVDEAHSINHLNHKSSFMRVLRHFKQNYNDMRLLGATGTNFRFKGSAIVGDNCLFKTQVGNITTEQLIKDGYLINPSFKVDPNLIIDFSNVKIKSNGQFDQKQLADVVEQNTRLTELICKQVIHIMQSQNRFGVFFFATTKKHAYEILSHLPPDESAIILGETEQDERTKILNDARMGKIRFLVNIAIISVGVDIPAYDTIAYLRPTESLVLLVQTMGRALRLSPATAKKEALIMDFAGNIDRHRDWDNPLLLEALKQTVDQARPLVIECPVCSKLNPDTSRRCIGAINNARCQYYFEWKDCHACNKRNDIAARICRYCDAELIDPNEKLSLKAINKNQDPEEYRVQSCKMGISDSASYDDTQGFRVTILYECIDKEGCARKVVEYYNPFASKVSMHVFYGQFIKKHCEEPHRYYEHILNKEKMVSMINKANCPATLFVNTKDKYDKIVKKVFL